STAATRDDQGICLAGSSGAMAAGNGTGRAIHCDDTGCRIAKYSNSGVAVADSKRTISFDETPSGGQNFHMREASVSKGPSGSIHFRAREVQIYTSGNYAR
ncbi:unnamed protein product, partial [Meganyctiphanes norvegica]